MLALLLLPRPAGATDVVVVHSDPYFTADVVAKLNAFGNFGTIGLINAGSGTPSAATLAAFDAVLVYSNGPFLDPTLLGDRLADFSDTGGGVVECLFANGVTTPLLGRFRDDGYEPFSGETLGVGTPQQLQILDPTHPVMTGVAVMSNGTDSYHLAAPVLSATALRLADWSTGDVAVASDDTHTGRIVGLNFFPASSDALAGLWDANTDGGLLIVNALTWAGGLDLDLDGWDDPVDNCVGVANRDQADSDADTVGDACDQCAAIDTDVDGICDDVDACPGFDDWVDRDGDQTPDGCDICPEDNPDDPDQDGVCTSIDPCVGSPNEDADADGICDSDDACPGRDDTRDRDGDGQADGCDCGPDEPLAQTDAVEVCDGVDNDCDGEIDPPGSEGGTVYFLDLDGDGYGDDFETITGCERPLNYVSTPGDCNDDAATIHPDAGEFCDGQDNDCDGITDPDCEGEQGTDEQPLFSCLCSSAGAPTAGWIGGAVALWAIRRRRPFGGRALVRRGIRP